MESTMEIANPMTSNQSSGGFVQQLLNLEQPGAWRVPINGQNQLQPPVQSHQALLDWLKREVEMYQQSPLNTSNQLREDQLSASTLSPEMNTEKSSPLPRTDQVSTIGFTNEMESFPRTRSELKRRYNVDSSLEHSMVTGTSTQHLERPVLTLLPIVKSKFLLPIIHSPAKIKTLQEILKKWSSDDSSVWHVLITVAEAYEKETNAAAKRIKELQGQLDASKLSEKKTAEKCADFAHQQMQKNLHKTNGESEQHTKMVESFEQFMKNQNEMIHDFLRKENPKAYDEAIVRTLSDINSAMKPLEQHVELEQ